MKKVITVLCILLLTAGLSTAGQIYIWTDEDGVKRFSDQPPEDAEYETAESVKSSPATDTEKRPGFEKMIQETEAENQAAKARQDAEEANQEAQEKEKAEAEKNDKNNAERTRIQNEIDALKSRALSPTFSQGMRDNLIKEKQKELDALK